LLPTIKSLLRLFRYPQYLHNQHKHSNSNHDPEHPLGLDPTLPAFLKVLKILIITLHQLLPILPFSIGKSIVAIEKYNNVKNGDRPNNWYLMMMVETCGGNLKDVLLSFEMSPPN
jgi:hypothetical protein